MTVAFPKVTVTAVQVFTCLTDFSALTRALQIRGSTSPENWDDKVFVQERVEKDGEDLRHASNALKDDPDVVMAAVLKKGCALEYASEKIRDDPKVVMAAVSNCGYALKYAGPAMKNNQDVVMDAVKKSGGALQYASEELRNDPDVVMAAVTQAGFAFQFAGPEVREARDVVMTAVAQWGLVLEYASEEIREDRDVVMTAVTQDGLALKFASPELRGDRGVVMAAVEKGWVLQYASVRWVLQYASEALREDPELVIWAVDACLKRSAYFRASKGYGDNYNIDTVIGLLGRAALEGTRSLLRRNENDIIFRLCQIIQEPESMRKLGNFLEIPDTVEAAIQDYENSFLPLYTVEEVVTDTTVKYTFSLSVTGDYVDEVTLSRVDRNEQLIEEETLHRTAALEGGLAPCRLLTRDSEAPIIIEKESTDS